MRATQSCVIYSRKRGTWHLKRLADGQSHRRPLGTILELPARADAEKAAEPFRRMLKKSAQVVPTVSALAKQYITEKMPPRASTSRSLKAWLKNHILPAWGDQPITNLQARPVDLWLRGLQLRGTWRI